MSSEDKDYSAVLNIADSKENTIVDENLLSDGISQNNNIKQQHLSELKRQTNKIYTVAAILATVFCSIYCYYAVRTTKNILANRMDDANTDIE